jgi:hypothetical protein
MVFQDEFISAMKHMVGINPLFVQQHVVILFRHFLKQEVETPGPWGPQNIEHRFTLRELLAFAEESAVTPTRRPAEAPAAWKEMLETWLHLLDSESESRPSDHQQDSTDTRPAEERKTATAVKDYRRETLSYISWDIRACLATGTVTKGGWDAYYESASTRLRSNKECRDSDERPAIQGEGTLAINKAPNPRPDVTAGMPGQAPLIEEKDGTSIGSAGGVGQTEDGKEGSKEDTSQDQQPPNRTSLLSGGRSSPSALV